MATKTKRENEYGFASHTGDEAPASKKAKAVVMEERSGDDSMSVSDTLTLSEDEIMSDRDRDSESDNDNDNGDDLAQPRSSWNRKKDLVREIQIFLESKGESDCAKQISSEKTARKVLTEDEMAMFRSLCWTKFWCIRLHPGPLFAASTNLTDYQRLVLYRSRNGPYCFLKYDDYYFTYEFDCAYTHFADDLSQNILWSHTESDARPIAEALWKKHMPHTDLNLDLLYETVCTAISHSCMKHSSLELASLFVDLFKRELDVKDSVQALKEIIKEKGLERYPRNKSSIEQALQQHKGFMWSKYCEMKSFCNIQNGEALEDNKLEELITNYFEHDIQRMCGYHYTKYVQEKISIAKELGILQR